jgi:hypothetical protein
MGWRKVLVEMRVPQGTSAQHMRKLAGRLADYGFDWDPDYLVPLEHHSKRARKRWGQHRVVLLRGQIEEGREPDLEANPDIIRVWSDAPVEPLANAQEEEETGESPKSPFTF